MDKPVKVKIKETGDILTVEHFGYTVNNEDGSMSQFNEQDCIVIEEEEYDTDNVEDTGTIERVLPEEPEIMTCDNCEYSDKSGYSEPCDTCTRGITLKRISFNWTPKKPIVQKEKKIKLKISEKKLKYLQEIICDKCMKCDEECNEPCNLSRYIKKERE